MQNPKNRISVTGSSTGPVHLTRHKIKKNAVPPVELNPSESAGQSASNKNSEQQEITGKKFLFDYHSAFYKLFHLPLDWIDKDRRNLTICGKEHCNLFCVKIMENPEGANLCESVSREAVETGIRTRKPVITRCHAGFYDVLIPIFIGSQYIGSLCIGQYLLRNPTREDIKSVMQKLAFLNLSEDELKNYYRRTRKFTAEEAEGMIELVRHLGEYICETYGKIYFMESVKHSDSIRSAELYIQRHYANQLTVSGIARAIGISKSFLLHKFAHQTGLSPMAYLNRYRISKAEELLINTGLTASEIADLCGFSNAVTFNRNFRKINNMSPGKFRAAKKS